MQKLDFEKGAQPLYYQIKQILKDKIENGEYRSEETIPSESELQEIFNVSRITVRQAINELVNEGYLSRKRGKGTIVVPHRIEEILSHIKSFTDEMIARGLKPSTSFAEISIVKAPKKVALALNISKGDEVYRVKRIRCADDEPIVVFDTYLIIRLDLPLDNSKYYGSLYELIDETNRVKVSKAIEYIEAIVASEDIADMLEIEEGAPVLKTVRTGFDSSRNPIEYTVCYYRGDKYRYFVSLDSLD